MWRVYMLVWAPFMQRRRHVDDDLGYYIEYPFIEVRLGIAVINDSPAIAASDSVA